MKKKTKKDSKTKIDQFSFFPESKKKQEDVFIKDELNIAEYPIALLTKHVDAGKNKITIYPGSNREWTLVGNPEMGGIPLAHDQDYYYALLDLLYEQTGFSDNTIYFTIYQLILRAGKKPSKQEYKRAIDALQKFRGLIIRSKTFKYIDEEKDEIKYINEDISLLQHFTIIGDVGRGRKQKLQQSTDGYCQVIFTDFFLDNLRSKEMSKTLNFSFLMKLETPLGRRYFRLIDFWKHKENKPDEKDCVIKRDINEVANLLPITDKRYPSLIKRHLDPVHKELKALFYLQDVYYSQGDGNGNYINYIFSPYSAEQSLVINELIGRGVSEIGARNLAVQYEPGKIIDAIKYYDLKKEEKPLSPGYLVKIISEADRSSLRSFIEESKTRETEEKARAEKKEKEKFRMFYEQDMQSKINKAIKKLSKEERTLLEDEAKEKAVLYGSEKTKKLALEGALREIVKEKLELPTFEEWFDKNRTFFKNQISN